MAAMLGAQVAQHLGEHPLQRVARHSAAGGPSGVFHGGIAVVADVEGGAVEVAAVLGGIAVVAAQPRHVVLGAHDARHDDLVERHALHLQAVEERPADVLQQQRGAGHQVGNAAAQGLHVEIGVAPHVDQLRLSPLGLPTVDVIVL